MLQNLRQISILNKIFNVQENEWSKVFVSWMVRFLYRLGFVIGWTVIVATFVSKYGIDSLPYLFVINAIFTMIGSFLYSTFLDRFKLEYLMIGTVVLASIVLFVATLFAATNEVLYFALLLVSVSIFLSQFKIILDSYVEELFTPLESERVFPVIEAADTVGGIVAGLAIVFMSGVVEITTFIRIWSVLLLLIIPCVLSYRTVVNKISFVRKRRVVPKHSGVLSRFKEEFSNARDAGFIKRLFLLVFLQWLLFNLLEFQYTKAVYQNVSNVVLEAGSGFEHAFVHDLGVLFILFSSSALVIQFFLGGRILNYLGVVGGMILHSVVTLFSLFGLLLSFNFTTAVLAKNNFTITSVLHNNAYHSSYYAIKENFRTQTREFLEGVIRPIGAVAGTVLLIALQKMFVGTELIFYVNVVMVVVAIVMFYVTYAQQDRYTSVAVHDLLHGKSCKLRLNAVDILAQKGHEAVLPSMTKILLNEKEPISLRVNILKAFAELRDFNAVPTIMKCFSCSKPVLREAAVDALLSYRHLNRGLKESLVIRYDLITSLKSLFKEEKDEIVRSKVVRLFSVISNVSTIDFLLSVLKSARGRLKADAIFALGNYNDPSIVKFVRPYLKARDAWQRVSALIVMGRFKKNDHEVTHGVLNFLNSKKSSDVALGLYALGELKVRTKREICERYLDSADSKLRMHAAIALVKMGYRNAVPVIIELLFCCDLKLAAETKRLLDNVDVPISKNIDKIVKQLVAKKVDKLVIENEDDCIEDIGVKTLKNLGWMYCLVEEYDEVEVINTLLNK